MSERPGTPREYDFRGSETGTIVPVETSEGWHYFEKADQRSHDSSLDNWLIHTPAKMGESVIRLVNLLPNPNGQSTWTSRADMRERGGIGYVDEKGITHDLGRIAKILDEFTVRNDKEEADVPAAQEFVLQ